MYKALNETTGSEENNTQVNTLGNRLADLMEVLKSSPTSDVRKLKNRNHMLQKLPNVLFTLIN